MPLFKIIFPLFFLWLNVILLLAGRLAAPSTEEVNEKILAKKEAYSALERYVRSAIQADTVKCLGQISECVTALGDNVFDVHSRFMVKRDSASLRARYHALVKEQEDGNYEVIAFWKPIEL
jgi:hypothetical protein